MVLGIQTGCSHVRLYEMILAAGLGQRKRELQQQKLHKTTRSVLHEKDLATLSRSQVHSLKTTMTSTGIRKIRYPMGSRASLRIPQLVNLGVCGHACLHSGSAA